MASPPQSEQMDFMDFADWFQLAIVLEAVAGAMLVVVFLWVITR